MDYFSLANLLFELFPVISAGVSLVLFVLFALYCRNLQQTMQAITHTPQPLPAATVWLTLIPVAGIVWLQVYNIMLAAALQRELAALAQDGDGGKKLASALAISLPLCLLPYIGAIACIAAIALFILHWIKMTELKHNLHALQQPEPL